MRRCIMDKERLKKLLATFSLATLLSGAGVTIAGGSSSGGANPGTGGAEGEKKQAGKTG
jgi:hypothetical protein